MSRRRHPLPLARFDVYAALAGLLEELEAELRRLGLWESDPPSPRALASVQPFCFDTLDFHQWLQWAFVPRTREVVAGERPMPESCAVYPLAEEICARMDADTAELLAIIARFDALISEAGAAARPH